MATILANINAGRYVAMFVIILMVSCAKSLLRKGLSILFAVVIILAAIYLISPGLYSIALGYLDKGLNCIVGAIKG